MENEPTLIYNEAKFKKYFYELGYTLSWDFSRRTNEYWHEIYDLNSKLVVQIDQGVPVEVVIDDIVELYSGIKTKLKWKEYKICGEDNDNFKLFCKKVYERKYNQ
mgnify:CR=1 FL=1